MKIEPWWKGLRGEWYVVVQIVLFVVVVFGPRTLPGWPEWSRGATLAGYLLGGLLAIFGAALSLSGLLHLGPNLSVLPHPLEHADFVLAGPYKIVRHPIYGGLILASVGWAGIVQGTLTLSYALILFAFFDVKSRREERWLVRKFPEYTDYQLRVKRLLPFLY